MNKARPNEPEEAAMTQPAQLPPRLEALRKKVRAARGRLIIAIDATASREPTWDMAAQLQADMFKEAAKIGGLDVQLVYFRGDNEVKASAWFSDAHELISRMGTIRCMAGSTRIARVLRHIQTENQRETINATVYVGDAIEEPPSTLYDAAAGLSVPLFVFQEGDGEVIHGDGKVETVFRELARLTGGAYGKFDTGAAKQLGELLRAVAAFAVGGIPALSNQSTDSARKLLSQMKL
jgi:hypothetical protein